MIRAFLFFLCFFPFCTKFFSKEHQNKLALCAIVKSPPTHLKEWIDYHKRIGVTHFYLYPITPQVLDLEIVKPYLESQEITLTSPLDSFSAYSDALQKAMSSSQKLLLLELDEFLIPSSEKSISTLLETEKESIIHVAQRAYNSSSTEKYKYIIPPSNKKRSYIIGFFHRLNRSFE